MKHVTVRAARVGWSKWVQVGRQTQHNTQEKRKLYVLSFYFLNSHPFNIILYIACSSEYVSL